MPSEFFNCPGCSRQLTKSAQAYILGEAKNIIAFGQMPKNVTCPGCGCDIDAAKMIAGEYDAKEGCFIATAVYGDSGRPELAVLRRFRDEVLSPSGAGRALIRAYTRVSPFLARRLAKRPRLRRAARPLLDLAVRILSFRISGGP